MLEVGEASAFTVLLNCQSPEDLRDMHISWILVCMLVPNCKEGKAGPEERGGLLKALPKNFIPV